MQSTNSGSGPPCLVMPVDTSSEPLDTLQGHRHLTVLPFLSPEALAHQSSIRKQQQQQIQQSKSAQPSPQNQSQPLPNGSGAAPVPAEAHLKPDGTASESTRVNMAPQSHNGRMLNNLPPRAQSTRANIIDYLAWLNLMTRLSSAYKLLSGTKQAELESDAFAGAKKPEVDPSFSSRQSATGSSSWVPPLDDADLQDFLKSLPGALSSQISCSSGEPNSTTPAGSVARASGIERLVLSMAGHDAADLQLPPESASSDNNLARQRYNLAVTANQIFGEASSAASPVHSHTLNINTNKPTASSSTSKKPRSAKSSQKTVSLHPAVDLIDLPRVVLPLVGISTIPQSILGLSGSSGVPLALLQLKFGGGPDDNYTAPPTSGPSADLPALSNMPNMDDANLPRNPHHDYRIRHTASVHNRAKQIYDAASLKSTDTEPWCARHRVQKCSLCKDTHRQSSSSGKSAAREPSQTPFPGDGLAYFKDDYWLKAGRRRPLASSLSDFLIIAADAFRLMSLGSESSSDSNEKAEFTPLAAFYELVVDFVTQAVLEGYTLHGWTGKEALEVLFSVGTGTWEERKWTDVPSSWTTPSNSALPSRMPSRAASPVPEEPEEEEEEEEEAEDELSEDSSLSSASASSSSASLSSMGSSPVMADEDEEEQDVSQNPHFQLVKAATELFRNRTPPQAEFEREMRDRMHEFLDVPDDSTLESHLRDLSVKYPLSLFEDRMLGFFAACEILVGKPALVKNILKGKGKGTGPPLSPARGSHILESGPMEHFASRFSWEEIERASTPSHPFKRSATPPAPETKRRKA